MTKVINIKFTSTYDVYIGRAGQGKNGYFGNPYKIGVHDSRGSTLERYKRYFDNRIATDPEFKHRIHELKGKTLGCFCKPYDCHGDIIAKYLETV